MKCVKRLGIAPAVLGIVVSCSLLQATVSAADTAPIVAGSPLRTYTQTLTLEFASPADAEKASVKAAPVLDGKRWAFSARWDDNRGLNPKMHALATRYGMPGTYYLNRSREGFGPDYARKLASDGSSVGVHTLSHDYMPTLMPNTIHYEMLANRVERESETDQPINSYAAPFTVNQNKDIPNSLAYTTQAILRAGLHNQPLWTSDISFKNPHLASPADMTFAFETRPGDKDVDAAKYDKRVENLDKGYDANTKFSHCMYIGIHVAYPDEKAWGDIEAVLKKYAGRSDWWYCNMTQYAAYARQYFKTKIEPGQVSGATRTFTLTRPTPADLGDAVPITLEISGGDLKSASVDGVAAPRADDPKRTLINLPHDARQKLPAKIDQIHNKTNAVEPPADAKLADFPALRCWLRIDDEKNRAYLTITNNDGKPLTNLRAVLRLPQLFKLSMVQASPVTIEAGASRTIDLPLGERDTNPDVQGGIRYIAAEVDFDLGDAPGRVWATATLPALEALPPNVRDAARMVGPLKPDVLSSPAWQAASRPGAAVEDFGTKPTERWFTTSPAERQRHSLRVVTMFRNTDDWKNAAKKVTGAQVFAAAIDFDLSEASPLKLSVKVSEGAIANAYLNGTAVDPTKPLDGAVAGANRLVLVMSFKEPRSTFSGTPLPVAIEPASGTLTYASLPPAATASPSAE